MALLYGGQIVEQSGELRNRVDVYMYVYNACTYLCGPVETYANDVHFISHHCSRRYFNFTTAANNLQRYNRLETGKFNDETEAFRS